MELKGIDFGNVFVSSGSLNFFGQGWPYHRAYKRLFKKGFDFSGATFISKTTTFPAQTGNMPLKGNYQPKEIIPDCVRVNFLKGIVLNSVGLSGPGAKALFNENVWQNMINPFMISFMSLGDTLQQKLEEANLFATLLAKELPKFKSSIGVQVNVSCPNTGHPTKDMIRDSLAILEVFVPLNIPVDLKIGVADVWGVEGIKFVKEVEASGLCDCITCSNTIPWGGMPTLIDWQKLFGSSESPLKHLGGGGLSGKPLFPIILDWLRSVRQAGINMPIKVGGGILSSDNARVMFLNGADAIELGVVSILRPWRVKSIIDMCKIK